MSFEFSKVLRGYYPDEVDTLLGRAATALDAGTAQTRAEAADALRGARFTVTLRGYDRNQVDSAVAELLSRLSRDTSP
jgi:DivIVA domain-containing protein